MRPRLLISALATGAVAAVSLAVPDSPQLVAVRSAAADESPIYLDPAYSPEERAADLVSRMTLEEKASQMISSKSAAIPRLGVQDYGWWNEVEHGVSRLQLQDDSNATTLINTTSYPVNLSMGSTWNPDLMYEAATAYSDEAREVVRDNTYELSFYAPVVNLTRDPRWGGHDRSISEDPLLTAAIGAQYVNGIEGKDQDGNLLPEAEGYLKATTAPKHYAAHNSYVDLHTGSSDMDDRTLREYYTAQFRHIIEQSDPRSMMSSYKALNGTPAAANVYLTDTLTRQTFGFTGYFTSDCDSVSSITRFGWQPPGWDRPVDQVERTAFAITAGVDLNCQRGRRDQFNYANTMSEAIDREIETLTGTFNENDVDNALVRLFTERIKLGEFDDVDQVPWVQEARARVPQGTWVNDESNGAITQTPERLALAREVAGESIVLLKNSNDLLPLRVPADGPYRVAVMGHYANPSSMYLGAYSSNQGPSGVANQVNGYDGLKSAIESINPDADVDFYPGVTPESLSEVDPESVAAASDYDVVVIYVGTDNRHGVEGNDRPDLLLPGAQSDLIEQVVAENPNTIVYMETIGEIDVRSFEPDVPALLWSSYNGQRKGEALADVVLGVKNPSGHLPFSWYGDESLLPEITDYAIRPGESSPGRTYMYFEGQPAYPFGYGLSYTGFAYSNLFIDGKDADSGHVRPVRRNDTVPVSVDVTNTGAVAGADVVQLYATTPDAPRSLERPIKRLVAFEKVYLEPGESTQVTFDVEVADLAFFDEEQGRWEVDGGRYGLQIGTSSADIEVEGLIRVVGGPLQVVPNVVSAKPVMDGDAQRDVAVRVSYPQGAVIDPQLTVAMNDDTLYGYVSKGRSTPFPPGMTFKYESNRPEVVSVDGRGEIRTVGSGVATVTATVRYRGVTKSTDFVVNVTEER